MNTSSVGGGALRHPSPANLLVRTYGYDLRALGASTVRASGPMSVTAVFADHQRQANAAYALKGLIDGVQLLIDGPPSKVAQVQPSIEGVRRLLESHRGVHGTSHDDGQQLRVYTERTDTADHLAALLKPKLPDNTVIDVQALGSIRAE